MTDHTELKRAAEACKEALPLRYMESHGSLYIRNDHGIVFDVHQNRSFPEFMAANKSYADLALAASPSVVLALIAESERLNAENKQLILLECYGGTAQAAISLLAERDRLKAENEVLLDGMTQIMQATGFGDPAFAIACEVVGELCGAAMGKEVGHQAGPKTPGTIEAEGLEGGRQ
ncbi:hypothetical protein [Pseudomonas sp. GL-RE-26]|uniref:hypothetical protein n=1 Tax=Pseudomonas sp. GL-RE-26 TaxID=2832390 RepID=UPI001CBC4A8D|nr:hypothetical protein [Pseudomonas sp. GL-RE-26]